MTKVKKIVCLIARWSKKVLLLLGTIFLLLLIGSFTSLPYWARYKLGVSKANVPQNTATILVMGGGGIPSESGTIRLWYTNYLAHKFPNAKIVVAMPGDTLDTESTVQKMRFELIKRGVDSARIVLENQGVNTRDQALKTFELFRKQQFMQPLVVITSPEHTYRTVMSFEKAGFTEVSGYPTFEAMLETDLSYKTNQLGGNKVVPDVGKSQMLRYKFWDYMHYELVVIREYLAIAYYYFKGWI